MTSWIDADAVHQAASSWRVWDNRHQRPRWIVWAGVSCLALISTPAIFRIAGISSSDFTVIRCAPRADGAAGRALVGGHGHAFGDRLCQTLLQGDQRLRTVDAGHDAMDAAATANPPSRQITVVDGQGLHAEQIHP